MAVMDYSHNTNPHSTNKKPIPLNAAYPSQPAYPPQNPYVPPLPYRTGYGQGEGGTRVRVADSGGLTPVMGGGFISASVLFAFRSTPMKIKANNPSLPSIWTSTARQPTSPDAQNRTAVGGLPAMALMASFPFGKKGSCSFVMRRSGLVAYVPTLSIRRRISSGENTWPGAQRHYRLLSSWEPGG